MLQNIKTIIIDEISMVRIDVFTKVMQIVDYIKNETGITIRVIVVGDFGQLKPVVTLKDKQIFKDLFPNIKGYYAFYSDEWSKANFSTIILYHIKRQKDAQFINHLTGIKYGRYSDINWFMDNASKTIPDNAIYICTTRKRVMEYNQKELSKYDPQSLKTFKATYNGNLTDDLPCPETLTITEGVRVMAVFNSKKYKNGNIGTVKSITDTSIKVKLDNGKEVYITPKEFRLDNGTTYKQYPLTLAYAITVHKSQGSTFQKAVIVCDDFFDSGMLYTALSRCTDIKNIAFVGKLKPSDLKVDEDALRMTVSQNINYY